MRYDHVLYDCMLKILQHGKEKLLKRGNGVMAAEVDKVYQGGINDFCLPHNQLAWALGYICTEQGVLPPIGLDTFNDDERKAIEDKDLTAPSTKEARKAVKIAHERILEFERLRPIREAEEKLDKTKKVYDAKRTAAKAAQAERDRPGKELEAAEKEAKQAAAELKKAEKEISE